MQTDIHGMCADYAKALLLAVLLMLMPVAGVSGEITNAVMVGDRECSACHRIEERGYLDSLHGRIFRSNPRTAREAAGCESCHGPGSRHVEVAGDWNYEGPMHIRTFGDDKAAGDINTLCLDCHQGGQRMHWQGSSHALEGLACTACHAIHQPPPADPMAACLTCHTTRRAMLQRSSHMPMREGRVTCMDCHDPHGGLGPSALRTTTVNETCYGCHAEKRGPHIFEHPPVREDCSLCHEPHGSNHQALLKREAPWLCQQCHSSAGHSGRLFQGQDLSNPGVAQLRGQACANCHSRIHGSSHPSGARFQR